ncbi:NUDIX domain-containing protein [Longispora sp. K20-0274]|uniref:NUDIX hydrolase n=1 Tax=Longispora sp. K20-0274 TaxID=3088255 RepID=UPI00399A6594
MARALADVVAERVRQHAAWGDQSGLPDGTGPRWRDRADAARAACQAAGDTVTWRHLVEEEFAEALAETDPHLLYGELTQLGGLVVQWMQALRARADLPPADVGLLAGLGRYRSIVDLHVVLRHPDGRILLAQRANTGYADGHWHLPSGHLEPGESLEEGAAREAGEELGIDIAPGDLRLVHVMHHKAPGEEPRVGCFFDTDRWAGEPVNAEPEKCSGLRWVDPTDLPEPMVEYARAALSEIAAGSGYTAHGFPAPIAGPR